MNHRIPNRIAALAIVGLVSTSVGVAQDSSSANSQRIILVPGQGRVMILTDLTPPATTYALTGEQSPRSQSAVAWQKQTGPVYRFGNGSLTLPATR